MAKGTRKDLSPGMRRGATVGAAVQLALLAAAHADLSRRPAAGVRGPKWVWRLLTLVNVAGPIAYFACGRRR